MNTNGLFKLIPIFVLLISFACEKDEEIIDDGTDAKGTISLEITDAPIDNSEVEGAFITVSGIKIDGTQVGGFEKTTIDLLAYQNGETRTLGEIETLAKSYNSVTLILDNAADAEGNAPGSYVLDSDGNKHALSTLDSSMLMSEFDFVVEEESMTNLVLDFDLRKSIKWEDNNSDDQFDWISEENLSNALRIINKDESGMITGNCTDSLSQSDKVLVFAYHKGSFDESTELEYSSDSLLFQNAVTSAEVQPNGDYALHFLNPGDYELHLASFIEDEFSGNLEFDGMIELDVLSDVDISTISVETSGTTTIDLSLTGILSL